MRFRPRSSLLSETVITCYNRRVSIGFREVKEKKEKNTHSCHVYRVARSGKSNVVGRDVRFEVIQRRRLGVWAEEMHEAEILPSATSAHRRAWSTF